MRAILLTLSFISLMSFAHAEDVQSSTTWIDTNTVLISNSQNPEIARRDCETTMRILSIMSNDKVVFRSTCMSTVNPRCTYFYCYELNAKLLVLSAQAQE